MVGLERLKNVAQLILEVISAGVPGGFAELGVWRGGTCIFAKGIFDAMGENRSVHVFDAFESISSYDAKVRSFLAVPEDNVVTSFKVFGMYDENVKFHKGIFKQTVPDFMRKEDKRGPAGERLAILRVDANHHDSYQDALYYLYGFVPVGGFVIFDDVRDHPRAMLAWREFKEDQGLPEELIVIDSHSAYFKKTQEITIDFTKMHPPIDVNRGGR